MQAARLARFRRVLAAALGTAYYRPWLEAASLDSPEKILAVDRQAETLACLPALDPGLYLGRPRQFLSQREHRPDSATLRHPLPGKPRIAVLTEGFRTSYRVRTFADGLGGSFARFRPQVVAGPPRRLEQFANALRQGALRTPPTHGLLVLLRPHQPLLDDEQRARLWDWFRVPVFQQIVGFDGELLAWECEAHSGLHIVETAAILESQGPPAGPTLLLTSLTDLAYPMIRLVTPWRGRLTGRLCGCGQPGERVVVQDEPAARETA